MPNLDQILSYVIPIVIVFIFIAILYKSLKQYFDILFGWIKDGFSKMTETVEDKSQTLTFTESYH